MGLFSMHVLFSGIDNYRRSRFLGGRIASVERAYSANPLYPLGILLDCFYCLVVVALRHYSGSCSILPPHSPHRHYTHRGRAGIGRVADELEHGTNQSSSWSAIRLDDRGFAMILVGLPELLFIALIVILVVANANDRVIYLPRRFSLRALLIATTLIAVVLGLIAYSI